MSAVESAVRPILPVRSPSWIEQRGLVLIALAVAWFYLWTGTAGFYANSFKMNPGDGDYYNLMVDGFLAGQLNLKYEGNPELDKVKDPYDPAQNVPYRVLDMSYYKGKYYLYFGPAPVLALLLPWKVITGSHLPTQMGVVIFCVAGYWMSLVLLLRLRRCYFPEAGTGTVWLAALVLGLANMAPALLRRPLVYELAISCAFFFVTLSFWALHRAMVGDGRRILWLAIASAAYAWAILARTACLYGAIIFALFLGWRWLHRERGSAVGLRCWLAEAAAIGLPLGLMGGAMLLYNYLRFQDPLQFGLIYQLTSRDIGKLKVFSASYVPFNVALYFLMPAQHSIYFPYFLNANAPSVPVPAGYDSLDDLYGLLPNLPVVLLAWGAVFGLRGRAPEEASQFKWFALMLACWFGAVVTVFLFLSGAAIRYYVDFVPGLLLLACLGMWSVGRSLAAWPWLRALAWTGMTTVALYSVAFGVMVSFQHGELLRDMNLPAYNQLAMGFNHLSHAYNRLAGTRYGPVRATIKFPTNRRGQFEPLFTSGPYPLSDYIWVLYVDDQHVQFGSEHTNYGGAMTQVIPIDYSRVHTLDVEAGFFFPPDQHPYFAGRQEEAALRTHALRLSLDGVPYLETMASFYNAVSLTVPFGRNTVSETFGRRFSGTIIKTERTWPSPALDMEPQAGPVAMAVVFPVEKRCIGTHEPLAVTGRTGKGDIFFVDYLDETHIRFALDHWGVGLVKSDPIAITPGDIQRIEISLGSFYPAPDSPLRNRLIVRLNDGIVIDRETPFHAAPVETQAFGVNPIGGSACGPIFSGRLISLKRRPVW